ncbi:MAG: FAD-binding protein [Candidatus Peribacteraceae bacterium]|nr:FAD-binding protein [Candidatus Peribacteraceae bacterium]
MGISITPHSTTTHRLSAYGTEHVFHHFSVFRTPEEFAELLAWAQKQKKQVYILGNGTNTCYVRRNIQSLVLKNSLPCSLKDLGNDRYEISSAMQVHEVLEYCRSHSLASFYYLASVPATIGGALAMNAGRGREQHLSIYDFVESVTMLSNGSVITKCREDMKIEYRKTMFTGVQPQLILHAVFRFPAASLPGDPIAERIEEAVRYCDYSGPNCGSVFQAYNGYIMRCLRGVRIGGARYSPTRTNWITNHSRGSRGIVWLIGLAKILHKLLGQRIVLEQVCVR